MKYGTTHKSLRPTLEPNDALLEVRDLHVCYGNIRALKGISMEIKSGEVVSIIGANGAGKSTLLRTVSGLIVPKKGDIAFCGVPVKGVAPEKITRLGLVHVPEGRQVLASMSVRENLELGTFSSPNKEDIEKKFETVFRYFPALKSRLHQSAGTLSGGEQQMLAIGRALTGNPVLLMMDEPSLGLAPILVNEIFMIIEVLKEEKKTILVVEQNAKKALMASDRTYVLENGLIRIAGRSSELIHDERIQDAYLGTG